MRRHDEGVAGVETQGMTPNASPSSCDSSPVRIDLDRPRVIDLTGAVPVVLDACEQCYRADELFRLIGTSTDLCASCFGAVHH